MILLGRCYFIHLPIEEAKAPRDCVTCHRHTVGSVAMQAGVGINAWSPTHPCLPLQLPLAMWHHLLRSHIPRVPGAQSGGWLMLIACGSFIAQEWNTRPTEDSLADSLCSPSGLDITENRAECDSSPSSLRSSLSMAAVTCGQVHCC